MKRPFLRSLLGSGLLLLAACAAIPTHVDPPRVSVADVRLTGGNLFEQRYHLKLRMDNPNPYDLPLERLTYRISLNGQPFSSGSSTQPVVLPKNGSAIVDLNGSGSIASLLGQLAQGSTTSGRLHYALDGTVKLQHVPVTFPFSRSGDFSLLK